MYSFVADIPDSPSVPSTRCVVVSIDRTTSTISKVLYRGWNANIHPGQSIWDVAVPTRDDESDVVWAGGAISAENAKARNALEPQTYTVRFIGGRADYTQTGFMTITMPVKPDAKNLTAVLILEPNQRTSANRLLDVMERFNQAVGKVKTFSEGLDLIESMLSESCPHALMVLEINNPLDGQYYHVKICSSGSTQGLASGILSETVSGTKIDRVDASGIVGTILVDEQIMDTLDPHQMIEVAPIVLNGFRFGAIVLVLPPRSGAPGTYDQQLVRVSAALVSRFLEHLLTHSGLRSAEATRKQLESRVLQVDSDRVAEEDILSLVASFAAPYANTKSILELTKDIGSCAKLFTEDISVLPTRVRSLVQAFRLVNQRGRWASLEKQVVFENWQELMEYCQDTVGRRRHEEAVVIFLDMESRIIGTLPIFRGTYDSVAVWPREVVKESLIRGGAQIIVVHNHPNGKLEPSPEDRALTEALERACAPKEIGLKFIDHVIVTSHGYYSFREHDLIDEYSAGDRDNRQA